MPPKTRAAKTRRKVKKNVSAGQAHIKSTFNNTIVSITDETGAVLKQAGREGDAVLSAAYDFAAIREARLSWGLFRDRRPECYGAICQ